jgi:hypothetical protein
LPFTHSDTWSVVVNDQQGVAVIVATQQDFRRSASMVSRIVEQVQQDSFDSPPIDEDGVLTHHVGYNEDVTVSVSICDAFDEGGQVNLFAIVLTRSGVETTELKQVENRAVETPNLCGDDVEGLLISLGEFI